MLERSSKESPGECGYPPLRSASGAQHNSSGSRPAHQQRRAARDDSCLSKSGANSSTRAASRLIGDAAVNKPSSVAGAGFVDPLVKPLHTRLGAQLLRKTDPNSDLQSSTPAPVG